MTGMSGLARLQDSDSVYETSVAINPSDEVTC